MLIDSMPPATAMSMSPRRDALGGEHHRLEPGAADLVDRQRGDVLIEAAVEGGLPRGVLAGASLNHVAHDALVDRVRIDAGAPDGLATTSAPSWER